ncbi:thiamine pyrophosphate-binding protein [Streptomyces scabiei]|uniref:thiamine pyrophosphate-binding protein n=1 Tax=Streptomyces scabiei TaxID=1930 RepID=UPI00298FB284|nr:thiamine pyrophosphate-binding protein [Streptomyces scabiei]MDW8806274.1 thiamine pyrophosphate-binding protein [Streptomyces scabiei]
MPSDSSQDTRLHDTADETDPLALARRVLAGDHAAGRTLTRTASDAPSADSRTSLLTGAEAVAALLADGGVRNVFVYAGTSELAICDALHRTEGVRLSNGRGDKESAFMAAGASLTRPGRGAAVLHGARGLTNAAGAVADARRNEVGTLFLVGLPSSGSVRFLPPHGEHGLIDGIGTFADWSWQAPAVPDEPDERREAAERFVERLRASLAFCTSNPHRPAIFGIPQDVAESRWIPLDALLTPSPAVPATDLRQPALDALTDELRRSRRPLLLLDDYALHHPGLRPALDRLSTLTGAAVLQVRYRRGPMLFERLRAEEVTNFAGWLNPFSPAHRALLAECDLLVTVEDRNIYERIVGPLPDCRKAAINTDPAKVLKNEYLRDDEPLVVGDPAVLLCELADRLSASREPASAPWFPAQALAEHMLSPERATATVEEGRRAVTRALAATLASWERPALVDDSQMFGGLLSEHYDDFPPGLRVFGDHGAFVGGGLAYATGLAMGDQDAQVMCTLGDQAFTNSFQGLVAAVQEQARVLFVVCNNGESVSLNKQAAASYGALDRSYLSNVNHMAYHQVAQALGVPAHQVAVPVGGTPAALEAAVAHLATVLEKAAAEQGPSLVEIVLPSDPSVWEGIWITQGFEETSPAEAEGEA